MPDTIIVINLSNESNPEIKVPYAKIHHVPVNQIVPFSRLIRSRYAGLIVSPF